MRTVPLFEFMPYGAPELQQASPKYFLGSVLSALTLWALVFMTALAIDRALPGRVQRQLVAPVIALEDYRLPHPPALQPPPPSASAIPHKAPGLGVPTPVDVPDQPPPVSATNGGDGKVTDTPATTTTDGGVIGATPVKADAGPIPDYLADKAPVPIVAPKPEYPDLAVQAQVEGLVVLKLLVDAEGKVRKVELIKGAPMLQQAAIDAAWKWVFEPAIFENHAVACWMTLPIRFRLHS